MLHASLSFLSIQTSCRILQHFSTAFPALFPPARLRVQLQQPPNSWRAARKRQRFMCLSSRMNHQRVRRCFAVDPMPLLLHKGRSAFSQLSSCAFQVLSFLPSAVISSSLAAEGSGRVSTHHRRWLISRSTSARGCALPCQRSLPPLPIA